jgi:hypothetical protein
VTKKIINQTSFTGGEISPRLHSRTDTSEYEKGLETATNAVILPHGPIKRRNGSKFIAETKDSSAAIKLVRYQFSQDTAFILEFGNQYIRFFKDNGQVAESDLTITGITAANPGVVTSTAHGLSDGDHVYITGVVGMTEVNSSTVPYKVANKTANTFELNTLLDVNVDTSAFTAYSSGGVINKIYEVVSPYTTAQLPNIEYVQSGSVMYMTHPDVAPRTLVRTSDTNWTLDTLTFLPPPTYESGYVSTGFTMTPSATTGVGVNFTSSSAIFLEGDIGRQIINSTSGETGRASIVSITSTTVAVCDIVEDFTDTNAIASADWSIDLSPVVDLEFDGTQAGSIVNIRSEYTSGTLGSRKTITAVTKANPGVVTSTAHGFINGDTVQIQDIIGMTQINNRSFTVEGKTANTFQLKGEDTSGYTTYSSGGIVRQDLSDVNIDAFRAADVGKYILANGGVAQIITVTAADDIDAEILKSFNSSDTTGNWSLEIDTWDATRGYPRAVGLYEQRLVYGGTAAEPQTLWFSETGIVDGFGTGPDDEDSIQVSLVSNEVNEINWIASSRDLVIGTSGGEITVNSGTSSSISPSAIQQQARTYHGSKTQHVANIKDEILFIQGSDRKVRTFRYDFNIDGYTGEDLTFLSEHITEGGLVELAYSQEPDTVIYVVTTNGNLLAGTYDRSKKVVGWGEHTTDGTFENIQTITKGEEDQPWVVVKRTINGVTKRFIELFLQADGSDDLHGFSDCHLTLSDNKTVSGITAADPAVVTATSHGFSDGDIVIIKDLVDPLTADLDSTATNMSSLNDCSFKVANKTANTFELNTFGDANIDTSAYNAYGSAGNVWVKTTAISGLDHLEGKTVQIKIDGSNHADKVVSSGAVTLNSAAGEVTIGLPYTTTIKTLDLEYDIGLGSMQGQRSRWARPLLRVLKSGKPLMNDEFIPARSGANPMNKKVPLFSGFLEYGSLNWSNTGALTITISDPLPLQLIGITGTIDGGVK